MTENKVLDMLGEELQIGDFIIIPHNHERKLQIAEITGFTPKKIKIKVIINKYYGELIDKGNFKYIKVDPASITFMLMKKQM